MNEIDDLIKDLTKSFGAGSVMKLSSRPIQNVESYSTGSLKVNMITGIGGFPKGRVTEIFGGESSGKTTLCIHAISDCQSKGGVAAIIDVEHAFDPTYASNLGVDISNLIFSQPDNGEQALEITEALIRSGKVNLVVVDSVAALVPKAELEGEMGESKIGLQARLMSQAMRKLTHTTSINNVALIFINQTREKIGAYGDPTTTPGGNALKFYASLRLRLSSRGNSQNIVDTEGTITAGVKSVSIIKNKLAPPFGKCDITMKFGEGVDISSELLEISLIKGLITKKGSWYYYGDISLGQGTLSAIKFIMDNEDLIKEIK